VRKVVSIVAALVAAGLTATALGAVRKDETYKLSAKLTAGQEVPAPKGVPAAAKGTFTGTLKGNKLTFKLAFSGLSGKAFAAHIHLGKPGKAGAVLVPLCGPCRSGVSNTMTVSNKAHDAIERNGTYVNVHTAKNAGGEIRGQVKSRED
jgi:CHRD domain